MNWVKQEKDFIMPTYKRQGIMFVRGKGKYLWDSKGKKYLDFFAGLSVCNLGHCPPKVVSAVKAQVGKLMHVSNIYYTPSQIELAKLLVGRSFGKGKVFFSNSGAEANECAIKMARKLGNASKPKAYEIITFNNSFHGRTLATLTATGQRKFLKGFEPAMPGFKYAVFNDLKSVKKLVSRKTCAIMVEPVQGEGGIFPADKKFLAELRKLCNAKKLLLIYDEVQCGIGRTGRLFAFQSYNVKPDIVTLAKSISNGLPLGVTIASGKYAELLQAGDHGSTFGGNIISCTAAIEVLKAIDAKMLRNVERVGEYFLKKLKGLKSKYPFIKEVRGKGFLVGVELTIQGKDIIAECLEKGLVLNCTQGNILRFLPPLMISKGDVDKAVRILDSVFSKLRV